MMRWWEFFRPTPRMDEEEWERVRSMSRARFATRVTGWAMRAVVSVSVLTVIVRLVLEPEFRTRMAEWRFVGTGLVVMGLGAVGVYLISAILMWPALSRVGRQRESTRE
jgi:hypothetical protein